jgi:hypothetical protein
MKKYRLILVMIIALSLPFLSSCEKSPVSTTTAELNQNISLKDGQTVTINSEDLDITFKSVVSDSRCPVGYDCLWEGNAEIEFFLKMAQDTATVRLNTTLDPKEKDIFNDLHIKLISVKPYPVSNQPPIKPEDYIIEIIVTKK